MQKNMRELEMIIQECILTSIRESIPTEDIIKAYMDESVEQEEEVVIENIEQPVLSDNENRENMQNQTEEKKEDSVTFKTDDIPETVPSIKNLDEKPVITRLTFNDYDSILDDDNRIEQISAPKSIERLEEISTERAIQRKLEEEDDLDDKIRIHTDSIDLEPLDILLPDNERSDTDFVELDDIEELL
jgi:hypothetical protein